MPRTIAPQHPTRFVTLAGKLFPPVQGAVLALSPKVVYGIAVDRNGDVAIPNQKYNPSQRADLA